eukprot:jgi/Psemu1/45602/gm1.45602_g
MTTSRTRKKCQSKSPCDVAARGTSPDNDSQAAGTKNHDGPPSPKKRCKSSPPSNTVSLFITQEDDYEAASKAAARTNGVPAVLTQVGAATEVSAVSPKANPSQRKAPPAASEVCGKQSWIVTEWSEIYKYEVCEGLTFRCFSLFYSIDDKEPMPDFRKKLSTESPTKKKKKERLLSTFGPIPCQIDVMVNLFLYDDGVAGKLGVLSRNELTNQFKDYEMKKVGDTRPCLYSCNVVSYVTIKKYMVVYQEIFVWYMENGKYPPAPEKMDQGLCFYTKCDNSSSHNSRDYVPVMTEFLDDLIAKWSLRDLVTNLYHIHFDFDENIVTLVLPFPIGEGKIRLAPTTVTKGMIHLGAKISGTVRFGDEEYKGFQLDDCLYTYPPLACGVDTQCLHVRFDLNPKELIKGSLEILDVGHIHQSVTWFLQCDLISQQNYLPESGKIFTPLTKHLEEMLVDQSVELFKAKLEVVCLSGVFKHLEGFNFKYHTLSDVETWECFKDSKADLQNFKESHTGLLYVAGRIMFTSKHVDSLYCGSIPPWLVEYRTKDTVSPCDDVSDEANDKGNKSDKGNITDGKLDNDGNNVSDKARDNVNKSDEGNVLDGTSDNDDDLKPVSKVTMLKELVVFGLELPPKGWMHSTQAQSQNGNNNELEKSVQLLNYILDVTVPQFPLRGRQGYASHDIRAMLKDPDQDILYPIY